MFLSSRAGVPIPAIPRVGGHSYLSGPANSTIADAGNFPHIPKDPDYLLGIASGKTKAQTYLPSDILDKPVSGGTILGKTDPSKQYLVKAIAREFFPKHDAFKDGDYDQIYVKIADGNKVLGWIKWFNVISIGGSDGDIYASLPAHVDYDEFEIDPEKIDEAAKKNNALIRITELYKDSAELKSAAKGTSGGNKQGTGSNLPLVLGLGVLALLAFSAKKSAA